MNSKVIVAVVAVVVLAAAGGGFYALTKDSKDSSDKGSLENFSGLVYGNSNGDTVVNSADIDIINGIMNGDYSLKDYPLADANLDGEINSADVDIVNKIINRETVRVYVNDTHDDVQVTFPMDKIFMAGGTNSRVLIQVLDMEPKLTACATTTYYSDAMDHTLAGLLDSGTLTSVGTQATKDDFKKLNEVKASKGLTTAILENRNITGYNEDAARAVFKDLGVDVLFMECESIFELKKSLATLGILVCEEEKAKKMIDIIDSTLDSIKTKAGDKYGTSTVMCITMSNSVSGTESDYFKMTELAGGNNLADWPEKTRVFDKGDTWLYESKYNPQFLFHFKSIKYGTDADISSDIEAYKGYFKETAAYKDGHYYLINGVTPLHVRLAWMAQIMYPGEIESDWADTLFQQYLDEFGDLNDGKSPSDPEYFKVSEHQYNWTVD